MADLGYNARLSVVRWLWVVAHASLRRKGKIAFLRQLKRNARVLDVGCGNDSPLKAKAASSSIYYVGLDVGNYNMSCTGSNGADEYHIVGPDEFACKLNEFRGSMVAVISSHNLEHCNDRYAVLRGMVDAMAPGGQLYLSFPSARSVDFPSRKGCLNFFDDKTHKKPVSINDVLSRLRDDLVIDTCILGYRPLLLRIIGAVSEPISRRRHEVMLGTWERYGFETIIWAHKAPASNSNQRVR